MTATLLLLKKLLSPDPYVVSNAIKQIKELPNNFEEVVKYLRDDRYDIILAATKALGEIKDSRAVAPLCDVLVNEDSVYVKIAAAEALGKIGDINAVPSLLSALGVTQYDVISAAVTALGKIDYKDNKNLKRNVRDTLLQIYESTDNYKVKGAAAASLIRLDSPELDIVNAIKLNGVMYESIANVVKEFGEKGIVLILRLLDGSSDIDFKFIARKLLIDLKDISIPILIKRFDSSSLFLKMEIISILGESESESSVDLLIDALKDSRYQKNAADSLVLLGNIAINKLLRTLYELDILSNFAYTIIDIISRIAEERYELDEEKVVETLRYFANSKYYPKVCLIAAKYNFFPTETLQEILKSERERKIRNIAALILAERKKNVVEPLLDMLNTGDENEKEMAALALSAFNDEKVVDALLNALNSGSNSVRVNAVYSLGKIKNKKAIPPLIQLRNEKGIRIAAIWALGSIGDEQAIPYLIEDARDSDVIVRREAVASLSKIGGKNVIKPLIDALGDEDEEVRANAVSGLIGIGEDVVEPLINELYGVKKYLAALVLSNIITKVRSDTAQRIANELERACDESTNEVVMEGLVKYGHVNHFVSMVNNERCHSCIEKASKIGNNEFNEKMAQMLFEKVMNGEYNAGKIFGKIKESNNYIQGLISLLANEKTRNAARAALLGIGMPATGLLRIAANSGNLEAKKLYDEIIQKK